MRNVKNKSIKWWIGIAACLVLFGAIGTFAYEKMSFLLNGVKIKAEISRTDTSPVIHITGNAKNAVYVSLNGREIFIDKDGVFIEPVALLPGFGVVTLEAQDKFGKTAEKKFEVIYRESAGAIAAGVGIINTN
ncbi:MAG: hypothetical protein V4665_02235 [Patescibacteria group bacterium]